MTGCRLPVEPAGRDLTDSANIGVTDSGFRTGLRAVPLDETDARSFGVIWTYHVLASKAIQSRGRRTAPAGFGAASRSPWIASSQGLLAMTEKGCF
jgi:hypothetical protein